MGRQSKLKPSDIIDWLISCVTECESDGYQQNEFEQNPWRVIGPPDLREAKGGSMVAFGPNGEEFLVRVTRLRAKNN